MRHRDSLTALTALTAVTAVTALTARRRSAETRRRRLPSYPGVSAHLRS
jgi:hypothetical protein